MKTTNPEFGALDQKDASVGGHGRGWRWGLTALALISIALLAYCSWRWPWQVLSVLLLALCHSPMLLIGAFPGVWWRRGPGLPDVAGDLGRRRPVWSALSELYLDTELMDGDHEWIAGVLRESGYSAAQLEEILYRELHPVLHVNLLNIAGEWAGFDLDRLEERILSRGPPGIGFAVIFGKWMVQGQWRAIRRELGGRAGS